MAVATTVRDERPRSAQSYHSAFGVSAVNAAVELDTGIHAVKRLVRVLVVVTNNADPDAGAQQSATANVTVTVINGDDSRSVAAQRIITPATAMSAATYEVIYDPREVLSSHEQVRVNVGAAGAGNFAHIQIDMLIGGELD